MVVKKTTTLQCYNIYVPKILLNYYYYFVFLNFLYFDKNDACFMNLSTTYVSKTHLK